MIVKNVSKRTYSLPGMPDESKAKDKNQYFVFTPGDNEISKENLDSVIEQNQKGWNAHYCKVLIPVRTFTKETEEPDSPGEPDELSLILDGTVSSIKEFADTCEDIELLTRLSDAEDAKEKSRTSAIGILAIRIAELKDQEHPTVNDDDIEGAED